MLSNNLIVWDHPVRTVKVNGLMLHYILLIGVEHQLRQSCCTWSCNIFVWRYSTNICTSPSPVTPRGCHPPIYCCSNTGFSRIWRRRSCQTYMRSRKYYHVVSWRILARRCSRHPCWCCLHVRSCKSVYSCNKGSKIHQMLLYIWCSISENALYFSRHLLITQYSMNCYSRVLCIHVCKDVHTDSVVIATSVCMTQNHLHSEYT